MRILNFCFSLNKFDVNGTRDNRISRKRSTRQSRTHSTVQKREEFLRFQPVFLFFSFGNDCFQYWLDACTFILKKLVLKSIILPKKCQPKFVLMHLRYTFCIFNFTLIESSARESHFLCCGSGSGFNGVPGSGSRRAKMTHKKGKS